MSVRDPALQVHRAAQATVRSIPTRASRRRAAVQRAWRLAGERPVPTALFVALVLLNVVDLLSTRLVLGAGGHEANPLMAPLVDGTVGAVAMKAACLAVIGLLLAREHCSARVVAVLAVVDVWYLIVVAWNVRVLAALL